MIETIKRILAWTCVVVFLILFTGFVILTLIAIIEIVPLKAIIISLLIVGFLLCVHYSFEYLKYN